jgi:hypothetical protein
MNFTLTFLPSGTEQRGNWPSLEDAETYAIGCANATKPGSEIIQIVSADGAIRRELIKLSGQWEENPGA